MYSYHEKKQTNYKPFILLNKNKTNLTSSSGPTRSLAPFALAILILSRIRLRFPSKSSAHWFKEHVASVILYFKNEKKKT